MATISMDVIKCCTCFKSPRYSQSLTDQIGNSNNRKSYGEILHHLLKLNSHYEEDCYLISQQICNKCANVLKSVYAFIVMALREYKNHFEKICEGDCLKEDIYPPLFPEMKDQIKVETKPLESSCSGEIDRDGGSNSNKTIELCEAESLNGGEFSANEVNDDDECSTPSHRLPRRCDICDKVYNDATALKVHRKFTHMPDERKMSCPICTFKSSRKYNLKVHLRTMHGQDSVNKFIEPLRTQGTLSCTMCSKKYSNKKNLQKHMKSVHLNENHSRGESVKPVRQNADIEADNMYLCTFCGRSFSSKYHLVTHVRLHTGEKPYKCDFCPKTFTRKDEMKLHRVIHSDEKPHQCTQCSKSFKRSDKLRVHMRVHSELRPYKCPECEKTFKYSNVMRTHMHIHTGQRPFECATCGEAFSLRTSLNIHCTKNNHVKLKSSSNKGILLE